MKGQSKNVSNLMMLLNENVIFISHHTDFLFNFYNKIFIIFYVKIHTKIYVKSISIVADILLTDTHFYFSPQTLLIYIYTLHF